MLGTLAILGAGAALKGGSDYLKGAISNRFAETRARDQAALEYTYAQRFAENSPSWNVIGLRKAGLNPILAASGGFSSPTWSPSSPSTINTDSGVGVDTFDNMLTSRQNRTASQSQVGLNESQSGLNDANVDLAKANTAVKLLEAQKIKQDLKGGGYKNPIVNDVVRGMNETAEALKNSPSNSPDTKDSRSAYIKVAPDSSNYSKDTFFGSVQASIDANNEVSRITGKSVYQVSKMSDSEKIKILQNAKKAKFKSKGYHIFTR